MSPDLPLCETCGAVLDPTAPGGLCRRCLLAQAMQPTEPSAGVERQPPPAVETVQTAFPQLEILEFIGQGGMGWVFKARQPKLNRFVALKLLPASFAEGDAAFAGRFEREGELLARLHHPNIVAVHDSGAAGGFFYLLMEYVEGVNLRQAMRSSRFTPAQALAIVPRICDALQFAHDEGVLHRDIKPENILLDGKGRVKLADFGIAKLIGGAAEGRAGGSGAAEPDLHLTHAGALLGTPSYMAPEQREAPGEVDQRADIYSLGVVFYELLTGELPTGAFPPPSTISAADPRVDAIVQQALEKERARRQSSAGEMKTQVETIAGSPRSAPDSAANGPEGPPRFSRAAIAGAAWTPFFFGAAAFISHAIRTPFPSGYNFAATMLLFLSFASCFGTTLLGWIAVAKIRRSAGKLQGLGLAVFDGLLFPLLALGTVIAWLWMTFCKLAVEFYSNLGNVNNPQVHPPLATRLANIPGQHPEVVKLGAVLMVIVVNWFIIRTVWRKVNQTNRGEPAPRIPWRWLGAGLPLLVVTGILGPLCAIGVIVWSLRESSGRSAARSDASANGEFGPVIEQVIAVGATEHSFFNLERGFLPSPTGFDPTDRNSAGELWAWNTAHQVDLFARQNDGKPTLVFSEMAQTGLNEEDFDRLTPAQLKNLPNLKVAVDAGLRPQEQSLVNPGKLRGKHTWAFQTRFEKMGLLQEMGVTSDPPGVKIRYKLLRTGEASARAASPAFLGEEPRLESKDVSTHATSPVSAVFGLQAERTITTNDANRDGVVAFRLQDDVPIRPPDALTSHFQAPSPRGFTPELRQWMRDNHADMLFHFSEKSYDVFTLDMRNGYGGPPTDWNTIVPAGVFPVLAKAEALNTEPGPGIASGCGYRDGRSDVKVFRTRGGLVGYYQLHGLDDLDGRGVEIRSKMVLEQPGFETAKPKSAASGVADTPSFGPVVELTIGEQRTQDFMVDLDEGEVLAGAFPSIQGRDSDQTRKAEAAYLKSRGIDLLGAGTCLIGVDMASRQVEESDWEQMSAGVLRDAIASCKSGSIAELKRKMPRKFPETYIFKTREGGMGLLQLLEILDAPQRVKIRYKMARQASGEKSPSLSSIAEHEANPGSALIARLPHGTVELLALTQYPIPNPMVWAPDGLPFKGKSPWEGDRPSSGMHVEGAKVVEEMACRVSSEGGPSEPVIRFDNNPGMNSPYHSTHWEDEERTRLIFKAEIASPSPATEADFRIGVAEGEWETVLRVQPARELLPATGKVQEPDGLWEARLESVTGEGGNLAVTSLLFHYSIKEDFETRMVSVRDDEVVTPLKGVDGSVTQDGLNNSLVKMAAVNYERIKEFRLQRRRYHWVEFRHVSLSLGNRTSPEIHSAALSEAPPMGHSSQSSPTGDSPDAPSVGAQKP